MQQIEGFNESLENTQKALWILKVEKHCCRVFFSRFIWSLITVVSRQMSSSTADALFFLDITLLHEMTFLKRKMRST